MSDMTWLFVSDVHFPNHDRRMLDLWFEVMKYLKPGAVDLLGDIDDADGTGRWAEGTSREGFSQNDPGVTGTRDFLAEIHSKAPKADKHFFDGNHGWHRHVKWLDKNNPQSLEDGLYTPESIYGVAANGFVWHNYLERPTKRYGDIYAHHGVSISQYSAESVRNDVKKFEVSLIRGHSHRQGYYAHTAPLEDRTVRGWEIGHMCVPTGQDYDLSPDWQAGFAYGVVSGDEVFIDLVPVMNYRCNIGTKVFSG
ncbi:metallophosphoesterase [Streptomyces phage Mildred21]|uniref:Metallophosphoesterase n=1 Tax=Streptomyces phage Mildred21 TaxID=2023959 RepID=A0A222YU31_9CAUD|nr:metallophosphoesterase [Streptomyces phage Mildred21]ASR75474.1 metallophosphoesterase [Streptomyces phage Mildred21]